MPQESNNNEDETYKSYTRRWFILGSVVLLNLANYSHWISFASVHSKAAQFYQVSDSKVQLILTVSYSLGVPFCALATYILANQGLRAGLLVGAFFTFLGGLLCCLATFPYLRDLFNPEVWFWTSVIGQAITGMGSPFIASVPTRISQNWFSEKQRPLATTILGLSNPIGLVIGQAVTPIFVQSPEQIPLMNIVWFIPALLGGIMTLLSVTRSDPPTPPSRSAALVDKTQTKGYWKAIKAVLGNKSYLILVFVIGGAMGFISSQQIKNEPILCSLGYSNSFSGLSAALVFVGGIFGSIIIGYLFSYVRNQICCSKWLCMPLALVMVGMIFVMQMSEIEPLLALVYFLMGFFAIGMYPTLLDFAVEATYPEDESLVTAILFISSSIQGVIVMHFDDFLAKDFVQDPNRPKETCTHSTGGDHNTPQDHSGFVIFLNTFGLVLLLTYFLFFNTEMKRSKANVKVKRQSTDTMRIESYVKKEDEEL